MHVRVMGKGESRPRDARGPRQATVISAMKQHRSKSPSLSYVHYVKILQPIANQMFIYEFIKRGKEK